MRLLGWAVVLAVAVLASPVSQAEGHCPAIGLKAPPFSLSMADGSEGVVLHKALEKGVPVVVVFWAYDCVPCRRELPQLQQVANDLGPKATFLLIHDGPDEEKMKAKLTELNVTLPSASDDSRMKEERYCVDSLPRTYVLDKTGIIRAIFKQFDEAALRKALAELGAK